MWDTKTGVNIWKAKVRGNFNTMFHADQKEIILISRNHWWILDALDGKQLYNGSIPHSRLGASWIQENTSQFAICLSTDKITTINIYKLQPTSTPPLQILTSFAVPDQHGSFSFSQICFHASFTTGTEVTVIDVQDSKVLLQTNVTLQEYSRPCGQFSPNGCFFACQTLGNEICIWQNTPTGYVLWNNLRLRLPVDGFLWSPASTSILCWGSEGIQLLNPGNHLNPLFPNKVKPDQKHGNHLVGYSADGTHIATACQWDSVIKILNPLTNTPQESINTDMEIQDIKVINNTIFAVDKDRFSSWELKAGRSVQSGCSAGRVVIDKTLAIGPHAEHLTLSHDCSQIAFSRDNNLFLYDIESQKTVHTDINRQTGGIQFSLDGTKLWPIRTADTYYLKGLEMVWDWSSGEVTMVSPKDRELLFDPPSLHKYHIGVGTRWVEDPTGGKLLWLPPNWRIKDLQDKRWDGDFLALVGNYFPQSIIIKFQPQLALSHP